MEQLFLTILNRAVTAGWLVLLVMVLRVVLKKAPRAAHYGLWAIVAVRLLWPGDLLPRAGVSLVPTTEPISGDVLTAAGTAVSGGLPAVGSPAGAAAAETAARTGQSLGHIAAVVWLVGMAAMALYLAGSYVRLRVRLRTAVRLEDGVWESEQAPSPFVLGFIRPRIYLPFGLDRGSRDYVLAHERTHIRHRDHWVKPLAFLLLAVYWFNPLLWAAYILLCRDMEYACDEAVLRDLEEPDKRAYSQALLNCAGPRRAVTACPVAFGEICVKGRIRRALRYKSRVGDGGCCGGVRRGGGLPADQPQGPDPLWVGQPGDGWGAERDVSVGGELCPDTGRNAGAELPAGGAAQQADGGGLPSAGELHI